MPETSPVRRRPATRPARVRSARPVLEGLEDRLLLYATSGGQWTFGSRITYSFVPDGTSIGGVPSILFQSLNNQGYTNAVWQQQVQKAAAVWEAVANINLAQVADDGSPIGVAGNQQDDPRFGDIRLGGYSQNNSGQLGFAFSSPPFNGGTTAGDIFFNTDQSWQVNGVSAYDLETVAIHELGHALGMSHSAISTADMYATYNTVKQTATSDDIAGIQSIYGANPADTGGNGTSSTATNLTPSLNAQGQLTLPSVRIVAASSDVDWYYVTAPASTAGTMTVTMQANNLSSLSPRLLIYTQSLGFIGQVSAPNSYGGTVTYTVNNVTAGQSFYIRCQAAQTGATGVGAFGLEVNFASTPMGPVAPPNTVVAQQPDLGGGGGSQNVGDTPTKSGGVHAAFGNRKHVDLDHMLWFRIGILGGYGEPLLVGGPAGHDMGTAHGSGHGKGTAHDGAAHGEKHVDHHHRPTPVGRAHTHAHDHALAGWHI